MIGSRPIDLHIKGFDALGYEVRQVGNFFIIGDTKTHCAQVCLQGKYGTTVTGTINVLMASLRVKGETTIECAAVEPEVVDFCQYLVAMGAKIDGIGTSTLKICGGLPLHGCEYTLMGDRIEAGTFVCAGLATGGNIKITGISPGILDTFLGKLQNIGANVSQDFDGAIYVESGTQLSAIDITTGPHPGFPTDLQAQFCILTTQSHGISTITETVYPDRFLYVSELNKMGAAITVFDTYAQVQGPTVLQGSRINATDLRASAALCLAGLCADGETFICDVCHLNRGYENFVDKLQSLGANMVRLTT
jgi:UDP-N-acetylglucosamine 1-carboxyvinyltransferase